MNKKRSRVLMITGGQAEEAFASALLANRSYDRVIAVDRGLVTADRLGLVPDDIVGDFDSVPEDILKNYRESRTFIHTFPREKDKTDTQIALELALKEDARDIDILGATGSRLDHTLANVNLLLLPLQKGINACILDGNNKAYLKRESFCIRREEQFGDYVSLLPFTDKVTGLTLSGFKYPLDSVVLESGSSLGISNEICGELARVEFSEGILLVMETRD